MTKEDDDAAIKDIDIHLTDEEMNEILRDLPGIIRDLEEGL